MFLRWLRMRSHNRTGEDVSIQPDVNRFARIAPSNLSLRSAVGLGFGLDHVKPKTEKPRYNGSGLEGDLTAIGGDFRRAFKSVEGKITKRG